MPLGATRRAILVLLLGLSLILGHATPAQAKEYEVDGIVDCGRSSGSRCTIGDVLTLRTDDVTGKLEPVRIDVSWIRNSLPAFDQDDQIVLLVEDVPGGGLRALSITEVHNVSGTTNPGLSSGGKKVAEQPKPKHEDDVIDTVRRGFVGEVNGGVPFFFGFCDNKVSGGSDCEIFAGDLTDAIVGGTPTFHAQTKAGPGAPAVNESFPCEPIDDFLQTACFFTTTGKLFQDSPGFVTFPRAIGGEGRTETLLFGCGEAPGVICADTIP